MNCRQMLRTVLQVAAAAIALAGCTSTPPAADQPYKSRAVTRTEGGVRVSTAVLSADESAAVYGVPLATARFSPSGSKSRTAKTAPTICLSPGLDPEFLSRFRSGRSVGNGQLGRAEA